MENDTGSISFNFSISIKRLLNKQNGWCYKVTNEQVKKEYRNKNLHRMT